MPTYVPPRAAKFLREGEKHRNLKGRFEESRFDTADAVSST